MSGMSRELFDLWCDDSKNSVIIPGYMVKGTFAEEIGSGASKEIRTLSGETKPCRIQSHVISFSAHSVCHFNYALTMCSLWGMLAINIGSAL